ncbi:MAG: hypothetical protein J6R01_03605 [Alistipes sp.]|nr:hypothetical protein [Alistipes sp.]
MWGKILTRLFALFGMSLTCVACYGTMYDEYKPYFSASGRVVDEAGEPIPGIRASVGRNSELTAEDGHFYVEDYSYSKLVITDIDGEENGGDFESREIELLYQGKNDVGDIVLERKQE